MHCLSKKFLLAVGGVVVTILIGVVILATMQPGEKNLKSQGGKIELHNVTSGMALKEYAAVTGTFTPEADATIYYTVSSEDRRVLGAGNILPGKDNTFSRNLTFDAKNYKGKKGELQVYLQDKGGKYLDGVKAEVTFE